MNDEVAVRDATASDMADVHRIYSRYVSQGLAGAHINFEEEPPSLEELTRRREESIVRGLPYLVAELGGEVVGYSYAASYRERAAYRFTVQNSVYVQDGLGGRGIGKSLLSTLIRRCAMLGLHQMIAVVVEGNLASIGLHERLGFTIVGRLREVGFKSGEWLSLVFLQREITM